MEKRRVILYGKSIILGTVGASLRHCPDLEIVPLAPPLPASQGLGALSPDVIIFDLEATHPDAALSLLQTRPWLLLVGIDPENHWAVVWSGRQTAVAVAADLINVIQLKDTLSETCEGGNYEKSYHSQ